MTKYIDKNKLTSYVLRNSGDDGKIDLSDMIDAINSQKLNVDDENQVQSVCMDHCLSIDEGFSDALATVRSRFFETKQGVFERDDRDQMLPVTVIIDISVAPDHVLRSRDKE